MSNFAVSILDGTTIDIAVSSGLAVIIDHSNYDTNTEAGHTQALFSDYKKITVITPSGTEYLFSTLGDGDAIINTPSAETLPIATNYVTDGDGVYTMYLEAVPTWNSGIAYNTSTSPYVYYNTKLYKSILTGTNQNPATATTYWEEVDADDLPVKYRLEQKFAVYCGLIICYQNMTYDAICAINTMTCTTDLCKSAKFMNTLKLLMFLEHIEVLVDNSEWTQVQNIINAGSAICSCFNSSSGSSCNCNC
jgi:hypothetical protein